MSLDLKELLTLVGRLDDAPGLDTPRERFRRFLNERVTSVTAIRELLEQSHVALGDQHTRARQDLVLLLGRFLGFETTLGAYEAPTGGVRIEGHWRSRRQARIAIEVRGEHTAAADVESLSRTVAAMAASLPPDLGERWVGLCVTTPFYAEARGLETHLAQRASRDIRCISVESLLWLADMSAQGRVEHRDVLRLLTSGPDSDFMVNLMRRLTESSLHEAASAAVPPDEAVAPPEPAPRLSIVMRPERELELGFWLVVIAPDETATPELLMDAVVARRRVLGISEVTSSQPPAREGDWVCFLIPGMRIVGHAQLDAVISDASAVIRDAGRFQAVYRLRGLALYDAPKVIVDEAMEQRLAERMPRELQGTVLAPLSRDEYEQLTVGFQGSALAASS